jgi:hypothetical protein
VPAPADLPDGLGAEPQGPHRAGLSLIGGVRELHGERCGWCDYELAELAQLRGINQPTKADERHWWATPAKTRRKAIEKALGRSAL